VLVVVGVGRCGFMRCGWVQGCGWLWVWVVVGLGGCGWVWVGVGGWMWVVVGGWVGGCGLRVKGLGLRV
jgi:hypothetical protein